MSVVAYEVARQMAQDAEREANNRGYTRVSRVWKNQVHINRLTRLACMLDPALTFVPFDAQVVSFTAELVSAGGGGGYVRSCPFIETWKVKLLELEREWRSNVGRNNGAGAADHADIVKAYAAGLAGDMDTVDAFLCLCELSRPDTVVYENYTNDDN